MIIQTATHPCPARINRPERGSTLPVYDVGVIDVSGSMLKNDYPPCRLTAAREACEGYVKDKAKHRPEDHVGIVVFSDDADVVCPLLRVGSDAEEIADSLQTIDSGYSTDFCAGLKKADQLLHPTSSCWSGLFSVIGVADAQTPVPDAAYRHILFLSDGQDNGDKDPIRLARKLKEEKGIVIDCVGIGSRDAIDEEMLRQIASIGEDGRPRYRFIGDKGALLKEFRRIAALRIC